MTMVKLTQDIAIYIAYEICSQFEGREISVVVKVNLDSSIVRCLYEVADLI